MVVALKMSENKNLVSMTFTKNTWLLILRTLSESVHFGDSGEKKEGDV